MSNSSESKLKIVAAIPCYNEDRFIGSVVLKARRYADKVIVVDDGSTDKTAEIAQLAGAYVIQLGVNKGKGTAINAAFEHARQHDVDVLVLLDGDGQHDPAEITHLLEPLVKGQADVVIGSRFMAHNGHIPRYRTVGQQVLTASINLGSGMKLSDSQSGFRAFSKNAIDNLSFAQAGLSIESEMQFIFKDVGLKVIEVPITPIYKEDAKRSPLSHGLSVLSIVISIISRRRPLLFFGLPGCVGLALGIFFGVLSVEHYARYNSLLLSYTLLSAFFCLGGALSIFIGIVLHSLKEFTRELRAVINTRYAGDR